jgi:hypothetical protein
MLKFKIRRPSIPRNDRAASVEVVVDASLHGVLVETVAAKRGKSDRRNKVGIAKIIILILNFSRPTLCGHVLNRLHGFELPVLQSHRQ